MIFDQELAEARAVLEALGGFDSCKFCSMECTNWAGAVWAPNGERVFLCPRCVYTYRTKHGLLSTTVAADCLQYAGKIGRLSDRPGAAAFFEVHPNVSIPLQFNSWR